MNRLVRPFLQLILLIFLLAPKNSMGEVNFIEANVEPPFTKDLNICSPSYVNLTATGSTGIYRWYTSYEGGGIVVNPSRIFISQNKTFYVSALQLVDNKYIESNRIPLNINITGLVESPVVDTIRICGASNNFMYASGAKNNEVYKWYTDSLSESVIKISRDEYDSNLFAYMDSRTTYFVSILDRSGLCESRRVRVPIVIKPIPTAPVVLSEPTICGSGNIRFEVKQEAGYSYLWYPCDGNCGYYINRGGNGPSYNQSYFETYVYNTGGISNYTVWVEKISLDNFCSGVRIPITATSYKVEAPAVPHEVYQCRSDIQTISTAIPYRQSDDAKISWYKDKEKTQLLAIGTNFSIPNTFDKKMIVYAVVKDSMYNNCESDPLEGEVTIYPKTLPPSPQVSVSKECGKVVFDVSELVAGQEYFWYSIDTLHPISFGHQFINYHNSPYNSDIFYVAAKTEEGCNSKMIKVQGEPDEIMPAPEALDVERCGYGVVKLVVTGKGKYTRYRWFDSYGTAILGEYNSEYTTPYLYSSTDYEVSYIGDNGCESERKKIHVNIKPGPSMTVSSELVCKGESVALFGVGANVYRWSENGIILSNWSTIYVNPMLSTTYTLTDPTISGVCQSVSIMIKVNKSAECGALALDSIFEEKGKIEMPTGQNSKNVYPNPFQNELFIDPAISDGACRIYDLNGIELYYFPANTARKSISNIHLSPGLYILEIKGADQIIRERIVKL